MAGQRMKYRVPGISAKVSYLNEMGYVFHCRLSVKAFERKYLDFSVL